MLQNFQQRNKQNKHFKQFFEVTSFSDMEAATSTLHHSYGLGPRSPNVMHGAQLAQGPRQSDQGPSGAPRHEQQQQPHHKPFFYIQPMQPCLPMQNMQWPAPMPMPVSYNPYYGYPGLGKCQKFQITVCLSGSTTWKCISYAMSCLKKHLLSFDLVLMFVQSKLINLYHLQHWIFVPFVKSRLLAILVSYPLVEFYFSLIRPYISMLLLLLFFKNPKTWIPWKVVAYFMSGHILINMLTYLIYTHMPPAFRV